MSPRRPVNPVGRKPVGHFDLIGWTYSQVDGSQADRHVLLVLAVMSSEQGVSWPSVATISQRTGLSDRAVRAAIAHWRSNGVLSTQPRTLRGQRKVVSNEYHLNPTRYPVESIEEEYIDTPAGGAPLHPAHVTPEPGAGPIGIASESPEEQLHVPDAPRPRRTKRKAPAEDQLRGSWHGDDDAPEEVPAVDKRKATSNGAFIASLIERYRVLARTLEPISVTNKDAMAGYFMQTLKSGTDRQVLADAVDAFFEQQVYEVDKGVLWRQLLDALPRLAAKRAARAAENEGDFTSGGALRRRRA